MGRAGVAMWSTYIYQEEGVSGFWYSCVNRVTYSERVSSTTVGYAVSLTVGPHQFHYMRVDVRGMRFGFASIEMGAPMGLNGVRIYITLKEIEIRFIRGGLLNLRNPDWD